MYLDKISVVNYKNITRDPNNGMIKEIPISSVTSNSRTTTFNVIKHKDFKRIVTIYSGKRKYDGHGNRNYYWRII